jgi:UDP-glucose 4-epimerase
MKALVTGGAGFIGSHLADALIADGYGVTALDNLSSGSRENVAQLASHPHFRLVVGDVEDEAAVGPLVAECDVVFHLAAAVGVRKIVEEPVRTIETNVQGTEVVLRHANRAGRPVVLTSTSEVYGKNSAVPFREDSDLVLGSAPKHRWAYACSKALDEFLALAYFKEKQLPVVVARLFNTVGPRQTGEYGMVIPTFVGQALAGEPITVHGDGRQSRCFTYVADVVKALVGLSREPRAAGGIFNVGSTVEVTMLELAERVKTMTGSGSPVVILPYERVYDAGFEDMPRRVPDITRIRNLIGFEPRVPLEEILRRVIEHFQTALPPPQRSSQQA